MRIDNFLGKMGQITFFVSVVLSLALSSLVTYPFGSQNYSQFLTGAICESSDTSMCTFGDSTQVLRIVETGKSSPFRPDEIPRSAYSDMVVVGSINPDNAFWHNFQHQEFLKFMSLFVTDDVTTTQILIVVVNSFVVTCLIFLLFRLIQPSDRSWLISILFFSLLLGDFLPNSVSFTPIGMSSICAICAFISLRSLLIYLVAPQIKKIKVMLLFFLLTTSIVLVSLVRIDQYLFLLPVLVAIVIGEASGFAPVSLGRKMAKFLLGVLPLVGAPFVVGTQQFENLKPSALMDISTGFSNLFDPEFPSGVTSTLVTDNYKVSEIITHTVQPFTVSKIIREPAYLALDLVPTWGLAEYAFGNLIKIFYAIAGSLLIFSLMGLSWLKTRSHLTFAVFITGVAYITLYGVLIGPRVELRYCWSIFLGVVGSSLIGTDFQSDKNRLIRVVLCFGGLLGLLMWLFSILALVTSGNRLWITDRESVDPRLATLCLFATILVALKNTSLAKNV